MTGKTPTSPLGKGLPFFKVEGLGNDFVVVDLRPGRPGAGVTPSPQDPEIVRAICDRHFGVGGDGVLAILPGIEGDARMRVLNADGSEAEMCGNGIRCVARVLYETDESLRKPVITLDTGAGLLSCAMQTKAGELESVSVKMGRPRYSRDEIPLAPGGRERAVRQPVASKPGGRFSFTAVSMGNPHAVVFIEDPSVDLRELAETHGPSLEISPVFPRRTNVEFARVTPEGAIDLVVWERGCGITLACGTGACATAAAAALEERLPRGREIPVNLPGGTLFIEVAPDDTQVTMRGPARIVYAGDLSLDGLRGR
jgi:diaminopimelate epimerase